MATFHWWVNTFEQTLEDCYNSLNYLSEDGIILLHDCSPPTEASAIPAFSINEAEAKRKKENNLKWENEWSGDTWKIIPYLKENNPELNVTVLDADYGLGIVSKKDRTEKKVYKMKDNLLLIKT